MNDKLERLVLEVAHDSLRNRIGIKYSFRWFAKSYQFVAVYPDERELEVLISHTLYDNIPSLENKEKLRTFVLKDILRAGLSKLHEIHNQMKQDGVKIIGES